jgi:osmotically inducible protein OsmC
MAVRTARTAWDGTLMEGSGEVELASSGTGTFPVTFPRRTAERAEGTSPEELIAAALTSCYAMQLSGLIAEAGGTPGSLDVSADVSLAPDPAGGLHIDGITLRVRGTLEGLDEARFDEVAQDAKDTCPVSKALGGVSIRLESSLA